MEILRKVDLFLKKMNALHPMEDRIPGLLPNRTGINIQYLRENLPIHCAGNRKIIHT